MTTRESMPYDLVIVGGGPAGLSAAIRAKQVAAEQGLELSVCILEKGSEIGAHILSGAVVDPRALDELLPDWRTMDSPMTVPVTENHHWILTETGKTEFPHGLMPPFMNNKGCYTVSLGNLCRWLSGQAEALGVEIFPGFAAAEILWNEDGSVKGVATGDMGIARDGSKKDSWQPGLELHAKYTFFAEGVRGHLSKQLIKHFDLAKNSQPQIFGIGLKELWDIPAEKHKPGFVTHTQGWPLSDANGGGFLYHQANGQVALGFSVWLNYSNPYLSPFDEFQRWKTHPAIKAILEGGRRVSYGARAINDGGWQSVPKLTFPGGALIGCSAGFLNVPRIKGSHNAMKSGMLAAEAVFEALTKATGDAQIRLLSAYPKALQDSWVWQDLDTVRNIKPLLSKFGSWGGTLLGGLEMWLAAIKVRLPWALKHQQADHECTRPAAEMPVIHYPKPDGTYSFDKLASISLSNIAHDANQPCHLQLLDKAIPIAINLAKYDAPEQRYCPAGVYEIIKNQESSYLHINAQNCIHCKTCDIKDPTQNIVWLPPEGGSGPAYSGM